MAISITRPASLRGQLLAPRFVTICVAIAVSVFCYVSSCVYLNESPSMASGLYAVVPFVRIGRGDIVIACPPAAFASWAVKHYVVGGGHCSGVAPVVKRVIAVAGDRVDIGTAGIRVNSHSIDGSRPDIALDGGSRCSRSAPIPHVSFGTYRLTGNQLLLAGDRRRGSWDSRYWGPTDHVLGRAVLLFPS